MDLTDRQWLAIWPQMPPPHQGRGRPALDPRRLLDGIFWKIRTDSPWRALPSHYPSHQSCYRFYGEWQSSGLYDSVILVLYSDLVYRGSFTPFQAVAEKRIALKIKGRSFKLFIAPRYHDDWRTHTALLFMQIELQKVIKRIISESETDRLERTGLQQLEFLFSDWPKYAPLGFGGSKAETYAGPEDIVFYLGRG
jgi:transposase